MCKQVVKENIDFLPPYEVTEASMYIRPTLIGSNPQLGVQSSKEATFLMLCAPVGAYVGGALDAVDVVIARNYDRAAPNGSDSYKVGGNYACSLYSLNVAHKLVDKPTLESDQETVYTYGDGKCGPKSLKLYNYIVSIQKGEIEDPFGWVTFVK